MLKERTDLTYSSKPNLGLTGYKRSVSLPRSSVGKSVLTEDMTDRSSMLFSEARLFPLSFSKLAFVI
jgi:hypothetical protein